MREKEECCRKKKKVRKEKGNFKKEISIKGTSITVLTEGLDFKQIRL